MGVFKLRRFDCVDCGRPTVRKRHSIDPRICVDCGLERARVAAVQLHEEAQRRRQGAKLRVLSGQVGPTTS